MRYPYDRFIRFLYSRKADINATLERLNLPQLNVQELYEKNPIKPPIPEAVAQYYASPLLDPTGIDGFIDWTDAMGIRELWEIQPEFIGSDLCKYNPSSAQKACELFSDPAKRTAISLLIIRGFDDVESTEIYRNRFDEELSINTLDILKSYFLNFSSLSKRDWNNLLKELAPDQRSKILIGLQNNTKQYVEYSIGLSPKLTFGEILNDIMVSSYYKFKEAMSHPMMDFTAMKWADMAMKAGEKKKKFGEDKRKAFNEEVQLRFKFEPMSFPTLAELSTGKTDDDD